MNDPVYTNEEYKNMNGIDLIADEISVKRTEKMNTKGRKIGRIFLKH